MSEKKKKQPRRMGTKTFAVLWTLSCVSGWLIAFVTSAILALIVTSLFPNLAQEQFEIFAFILFGAILGLVNGTLQQRLMNRKYNLNVRGWRLWNILGWMVALATFYSANFLYIRFIDEEWDNLFIYHLPLALIILGTTLAIPATVKAFLLRRHIRHTWVLPIAAFVSGAMVFLVPFKIERYIYSEWMMLIVWIVTVLAQEAVMALTLVWLFNMMPRTELLKRGMESTQLEAVASNLTDNDSEQSHADYPDDAQMRQQS